MKSRLPSTAGFTYIELIIVSAITVIIFGAIMVSFQFALELSYNTRVKLSALSLANDRMEFFRSLPYDDVGVVAGFPVGTIPQTSTFELNGFEITEEVDVTYVDGAGDGIGGADSNIIITDFKEIRVSYEWTLDGRTDSLSLISYIVPRSIESDVGGGTIRINVLDADSSLLPGATVRVLSSSSTFAYDETRTSGVAGAALFTVPADSGYQAFVSATIGGREYSTSSTYVATTSNPIPVVAPFAVSEAGISTLTFQIGELSDMTIRTLSAVTEGAVLEPFDTTGGIATSTSVSVTGGAVQLSDTAGVYDASGQVYLTPVVPGLLENWEVVRVAANVPVGGDYEVQFFTGSPGSYTLIPDGDLPGNGAGFTDTLIDLSDLDSTTYPTTTIGVRLQTTDTSVTPSIDEVAVYWRESDTPRTGLGLTVEGDKIIGTETDATPIFKTTESVTTDGTGEVTIADLEFDTYRLTPATTLRTETACPAAPFIHQAGVDSSIELVYVPGSGASLNVSVTDGAGRPIPGASVELERGGYDETQVTNTCGQTYFTGGGLSNDTGYEVTVAAPGYTTTVVDPVDIDEESSVSITLPAV